MVLELESIKFCAVIQKGTPEEKKDVKEKLKTLMMMIELEEK